MQNNSRSKMVWALVAIAILVVVVFISLQKGQSREVAERDGQRLAHITTLSTALDDYFGQKAEYPSALSELVPDYVLEVPQAPIPSDGDCDAQSNNYAYSPLDENKNFELKFCLGKASGGYRAGTLVLTPAGIGTMELTTNSNQVK